MPPERPRRAAPRSILGRMGRPTATGRRLVRVAAAGALVAVTSCGGGADPVAARLPGPAGPAPAVPPAPPPLPAAAPAALLDPVLPVRQEALLPGAPPATAAATGLGASAPAEVAVATVTAGRFVARDAPDGEPVVDLEPTAPLGGPASCGCWRRRASGSGCCSPSGRTARRGGSRAGT